MSIEWLVSLIVFAITSLIIGLVYVSYMYMNDTIEAEQQVKAAERRAEIAERAVREFTIQGGCRSCPCKGRCGIFNRSAENDYQECYEAVLRIAEKYLAEEKKMSKCKGCGAEIVWIKTTAGKAMPCDPNKVTIVTESGETVTGYIPHWATCPAAKSFKKNKGEVKK